MVRASGAAAKSGQKKLTPAMEQFQTIKTKHPDDILFFHMGDFYETFGPDAEIVSRELDIALTSRSRDRDGNRIPLAGVPCHAAEGYISRLIEKGYRVAVCDQVEDAKKAKGIVKREVVRVITPGTLIDSSMLDSPTAHYLMAVVPDEKGKTAGLAFLDISTGEFFISVCSLRNGAGDLVSEVAKVRPTECIITESCPDQLRNAIETQGIVLTACQSPVSSHREAEQMLMEQFGVSSLDGYGCVEYPLSVRAAGIALQYAKETQKSSLEHISGLSCRSPSEYMMLDAITLRNLEILRNIRGNGDDTTLIHTLDKTTTSMGRRLLRTSITTPLTSIDKINRRLDAVEYFVENTSIRMGLRSLFKNCADLERIAGRISYGNAGPRDLIILMQSLEQLPEIKGLLADVAKSCEPLLVAEAEAKICDMVETAELIRRAIVDDPPVTVKNGGLIRDGYDPDLDKLREGARSGRQWIMDLQQQEREKTGIKSLKIGYNSVFGYYIEVTKRNVHLVPEYYDRKQTTTGSERYTLPALREKEAFIATADDRILCLETDLYTDLISRLGAVVPKLQEIAAGISILDVFLALAEVARRFGYVRPHLTEDPQTMIRDGRHPVVEQITEGGFVPNDTQLDGSVDQILIITGANMAGKSTYMRAVALISVMAQMGSFVPASYARMGVVDRIFTRVGAFDDLASGQSTFMVEMLELANILNNVTRSSLVILDEIGRGTSTLDGFCIARSVLEFLHGRRAPGPRTLFATHFHELVSVESELGRVKNYHFAVKDTGTDVIFLRKLIQGATDRSYGIHVAQLAGVPRKVTDRAESLMKDVMDGDRGPGKRVQRYTQMLLVDMPEEKKPDPLLEELSKMDPDSMTPRCALEKLYELRERALKYEQENN